AEGAQTASLALASICVKKKSTLFVVIVFFWNASMATPQVGDLLIYRGDTLVLFSNPLEEYIQLNNLHLDRGCNASSCNRGYIATWKIQDNKLVLIHIEKCGVLTSAGVISGLECEQEDSELVKFFNTKLDEADFFADWVTDTLTSPNGRILKYVHAGYESLFEHEIHFEISNGLLVNIDTIKNDISDPELIRRYNLGLVADTVFHSLSQLNWEELEGERLCADFYLITINKRGRVSKVMYQRYDESYWQYFWYNQNDFGCRRRLKKQLRNLNFSKQLKGTERQIIEIELNLNYSNGQLTRS
ncbi:MAG: hypothetical protein RIF46_02610, partial [Cyclobacteriaceae bacterium]